MSKLLIKRNGKVLYAIAYENPFPQVRYILARNAADAHILVLKMKRDLGKVVAVAPAIGCFGQHEERKRVYCFGSQ